VRDAVLSATSSIMTKYVRQKEGQGWGGVGLGPLWVSVAADLSFVIEPFFTPIGQKVLTSHIIVV
jgi:hypothetical protein